MSTLSRREKSKLEKLFDMAGGYVLDYSDATFGQLFEDVVGVDIHHQKYCGGSSTSKANKLREFWRIEDDRLVSEVLEELITDLEESELSEINTERGKLFANCKDIVERLKLNDHGLSELSQSSVVFGAKHIDDQIKRMNLAIDKDDPALAIGTSKELVETCCKTILRDRGVEYSSAATISKLTKQTLKELQLVPEELPEKAKGKEVVRRILQNLGTIGNDLAELRGLYGTGHGKDAHHTGLSVRHARLAVGAAATLVRFLFETHQSRSKSSD